MHLPTASIASSEKIAPREHPPRRRWVSPVNADGMLAMPFSVIKTQPATSRSSSGGGFDFNLTKEEDEGIPPQSMGTGEYLAGVVGKPLAVGGGVSSLRVGDSKATLPRGDSNNGLDAPRRNIFSSVQQIVHRVTSVTLTHCRRERQVSLGKAAISAATSSVIPSHPSKRNVCRVLMDDSPFK